MQRWMLSTHNGAVCIVCVLGYREQEPSWWPTAMQYAHGVPKGTLAENVARVEAKEKAAAANTMVTVGEAPIASA